MKTRIYFLIFLSAVLLASLISACKPKSTNALTIILADAGWDSQLLHNALAKIVIENAFDGYEIKYSTASSKMNWESLKNNDVDLFIEAWTDTYPTYPKDLANGDVVNVGVLVPDSRGGLYVPRYVVEGDPARGIPPLAPGLREVKDLAKYPHVFPDDENPSRGKIFGSIPGWSSDELLSKKTVYYGLDKNFNYVRMGSEATLFASLMSAYNLGVGWVGHCYEPSWIAGYLDLILLDDAPYNPVDCMEGKTAFSEEPLLIISSSQFHKKAPELLEFLKNYATGRELISRALAYLDEAKKTHEETAVWNLKTNDKLIDNWLPEETAKKLREYLLQKSTTQP